MGDSTSTEVNGFVGWLTSFVAFFAYFFWSLSSREQLERLGISYYPDRYWALSLPVLLLVVLAVVFFGYVLINMLYSPPPDDMRQFTDSRARAPSPEAERSLQLMAGASAVAVASAAAAAARGHPQQVNCQDHIQKPVVNLLQRHQQQHHHHRHTGTIGDIPLALVSRVLFPLNPNLEGRPAVLGGPPFYYEPLKPKP
ncbi:phosphatidylinositol N-acetylglucosaminyltransferase subunit, putative [Eimeria necatrix]|uniref:Phosphatidylinositol N-acetylglucosaminyltransferase subunit, putative n=1 Tax=Eimeria necatrix TaxID=51315 RepID=U6N0I3_9EIME|nr:phosphatidylinositol N-acetylglucosaminyltransferase subunit, putative [Eimeria necatrix]CDJ67455.1 phosphatidylinositol N-acetylglucosaminyltransferase subunit, putative [Eimeria necatrix]